MDMTNANYAYSNPGDSRRQLPGNVWRCAAQVFAALLRTNAQPQDCAETYCDIFNIRTASQI